MVLRLLSLDSLCRRSTYKSPRRDRSFGQALTLLKTNHCLSRKPLFERADKLSNLETISQRPYPSHLSLLTNHLSLLTPQSLAPFFLQGSPCCVVVPVRLTFLLLPLGELLLPLGLGGARGIFYLVVEILFLGP
jgi:hypothetical protein